MDVLLVISSLGPGGAERVMSEMANYFSGRGYVVTLITMSSSETDFFVINNNINRISLALQRESSNVIQSVINNIKRIMALRSVIKRVKPGCIISFVDTNNIISIIANIGLDIPIIVSERTDPRCHKISKHWQYLRRIVYPIASAVVVQTSAVCAWIKKEIPRLKVITIQNPLRNISYNHRARYLLPKGNTIVAIGRLGKPKGFDLLIDAFSRISAEFPTWNVVIFGEGNERLNLEELIKSKGLSNRIFLPGLIDEPMSILPFTQIFVLSSLYEGFPNVLIEAMACGLAVIAADCQSGPNEIITHLHDGILVKVNDPVHLAHALKELIKNDSLRDELGKRALAVRDRFNISKIILDWESLIQNITKL